MKTAIVSVNFKTEECRWSFLKDWHTAAAFLESIVDDFKGWEHTILESEDVSCKCRSYYARVGSHLKDCPLYK